MPLLQSDGNKVGLAKMIRLQHAYLKSLSFEPMLSRARRLTDPRYATFMHAVESMQDKQLVMVDGTFEVRG